MSWVEKNWKPLTVVGGLLGLSWFAGKRFEEAETFDAEFKGKEGVWLYRYPLSYRPNEQAITVFKDKEDWLPIWEKLCEDYIQMRNRESLEVFERQMQEKREDFPHLSDEELEEQFPTSFAYWKRQTIQIPQAIDDMVVRLNQQGDENGVYGIDFGNKRYNPSGNHINNAHTITYRDYHAFVFYPFGDNEYYEAETFDAEGMPFGVHVKNHKTTSTVFYKRKPFRRFRGSRHKEKAESYAQFMEKKLKSNPNRFSYFAETFDAEVIACDYCGKTGGDLYSTVSLYKCKEGCDVCSECLGDNAYNAIQPYMEDCCYEHFDVKPTWGAETFEAPYGRMPAWRRGKRQWNENHLVWASDSKAVREAIKTAFPEQKFSVRIVKGQYIEVVAKSGTRPADIEQFRRDVKRVAMEALGEIYKDSPEELREKYVDVQAYERDFGAEPNERSE